MMCAVDIKPLTFDHRAQAEAFAGRIPADERGFLDRTLFNQVSVASWTQATPARRLGAFIDDDLVGLVTVAPESGWSDHVADFRLVVAPEARARASAVPSSRRGSRSERSSAFGS